MIMMKDPDSFDQIYEVFAINLDHYGKIIDNGEWQSKQGTPFDRTLEIQDSSFEWPIPQGLKTLQSMVEPNLPWAEDHFLERISGEPLNPPPSHEWWPHNQNNNADHRPDGQKFSHTYPERFWPRFANIEGKTAEGRQVYVPHIGARFEYGDLSDLIELLIDRPNTRQAFLPIWFPEDLRATRFNERVPCTLGYHFMIRPEAGHLKLTCRYYMRSCDFFRHFRDDVYMAARLTQFIADELTTHRVESAGHEQGTEPIIPGYLVMHISSLHIFAAERETLKFKIGEISKRQKQERADKLMQGGW